MRTKIGAALALVAIVAVFAVPAGATHQGCVHAGVLYRGNDAANSVCDYAGVANEWYLEGGNDYAEAAAGSFDWVEGGGGNDLIYAGNGDDRAHGDNQDDTIYESWDPTHADINNEHFRGGPGDDHIYAGGGVDTIVGGDGVDVYHRCIDNSADNVIGVEHTVAWNPSNAPFC
jgi:hypothetical protein